MARRIGLRAFPRRREAERAGVTSPRISLIPIENLIFRSSATKRTARGLQAMKPWLISVGLLHPKGYIRLLGIHMDLEDYQAHLKTGRPVPTRLRRRFRKHFVENN
jgi:hypothetical protein